MSSASLSPLFLDLSSGVTAAAVATIFTNPLDVVKTRLQFQGELQRKGEYRQHYSTVNVIRAILTVIKNDGIRSAQSGLGAALAYSCTMHGIRLGMFSVVERNGWTRDPEDGEIVLLPTAAAAEASGILGSLCSQPLFLVKTRQQTKASKTSKAVVGYQHENLRSGVFSSLRDIHRRHGLAGLYQGLGGQIGKTLLGGGGQLVLFTYFKRSISDQTSQTKVSQVFLTFLGAFLVSVVAMTFVAPFDTITTRLSNQPLDSSGKGIKYRGLVDAFAKVAKKEGLRGFYKGVVPLYMRVGPQSLIQLTVWDFLRGLI